MSLLGHAKRSVAGSVVVEGPRAEEPPRAAAPAFRHPVAFARALLRTRPRRLWALSLLALALALALAVGGALAWDGVYPGVRAGGVDLGGLRREQAAARVDAAAARWEATTLTLTAPQGSYAFTREALGLHYDRAAVLARAYGQGRAGSWWSRPGVIARLAWSGTGSTGRRSRRPG